MPWQLRASAALLGNLNSVSWDYSQLLRPQLQGTQRSPMTSTSVRIQTTYTQAFIETHSIHTVILKDYL